MCLHQIVTLKIDEEGAAIIPFTSIELIRSIGMGSYGEVFMVRRAETRIQCRTSIVIVSIPRTQGRWRGSNVAVKRMLKPNVTNADVFTFVNETKIMYDLRHPNMVLFMGACVKPENLCLVTEFMQRVRERALSCSSALTSGCDRVIYLTCSTMIASVLTFPWR